MAAAATRVSDAAGGYDGTVLVLDDVTPLIRAQKVAAWREVARRLAHEIKNPLTPIQLSAERLRRKLTDLEPPLQDLVQECTTTIIGEVESLKGLVDEFSQFARMPAPRAVPTDLAGADQRDAGALRRSVHRTSRFERRFDPTVLDVRVDPEQLKRVLINLIDNAIEAMDRRGHHRHRDRARPARTASSGSSSPTTGPGIPEGEREKLFLPYYSTKGRGSGLGLAIVRRIVAEHGGSVDVADNVPRGTRFTIELPLLSQRSRMKRACRRSWSSTTSPACAPRSAGVLRDEGFDVEVVGTGEECLERVAQRSYDVIVLDVWLPGIDGLDDAAAAAASGMSTRRW